MESDIPLTSRRIFQLCFLVLLVRALMHLLIAFIYSIFLNPISSLRSTSQPPACETASTASTYCLTLWLSQSAPESSRIALYFVYKAAFYISSTSVYCLAQCPVFMLTQITISAGPCFSLKSHDTAKEAPLSASQLVFHSSRSHSSANGSGIKDWILHKWITYLESSAISSS